MASDRSSEVEAFLPGEPIFDPKIHLALKKPDDSISLAELGYSDDFVKTASSPVGLTSAFRVLSDEGVKAVKQVLKLLKPYEITTDRIPRLLRGTTFLSRFMRDLMACEELTMFISNLAYPEGSSSRLDCDSSLRTAKKKKLQMLEPHPMQIMQGHVNLTPIDDSGSPVRQGTIDKFHVDTVPFVLVIYIEDPTSYEGGRFEYFHCSRSEAEVHLKTALGGVSVDDQAEKARRLGSFPPSLVRAPKIPGAGYALFQQGSLVMHRATGVTAGGERTSIVQSYSSRQLGGHEIVGSLPQTYNGVDPFHYLLPDWCKDRLWRCYWRMEQWVQDSERTINSLEDVDRELLVGELNKLKVTFKSARR